MRFQAGALAGAAAALLAAAPARGQALPPLTQQHAWTEADKAEFLRYLDSGAPLPKGEVTRGAAEPEAESWEGRYHAARSVEFSPTALALFPSVGYHYSGTVLGAPGGRVLFEQHYRPWLRGYWGVEVDPLTQTRHSGAKASLYRWSVPVGLEFALVPLSTPQTRYVLLRAGLSPAFVDGPGSSGDYAAPLLGASIAWDIGLGYEWQFFDSRWRFNIAVDELRSITNRAGVDYYGVSPSASLVYTF